MAVDFERLMGIFQEAVERVSAADWPQFVAQATGDDAEMARQVLKLLAAHERGASVFDEPALAADSTVDAASDRIGTTIGPYKLLQVIGEGGMGVVYMAEQSEPVRRRVALKVIKPGMDSRQVIARFEAERQALSLMDHPNIARVLDAGATEAGYPYFVMELVKGQPITRYCDEHRLPLRQRLELLVPVCQAIQHAHQKGIIHRDIKPSNILVADYDQQPIPKVIDFGIAKAVHHPLTAKTMFTGFGQVVGTLEYMSPEQAKFNQLDIDTRSDVYSLGVLLYELLTGVTPLDRRRLRSAAWDEMLRMIREEEAIRPSVRLSQLSREVVALGGSPASSADAAPTASLAAPTSGSHSAMSSSSPSKAAGLALARRATPQALQRALHGELDWIVLKALDKDRGRRYESASALASDLQNYLAGSPVAAHPPTRLYRLTKFARRYRRGLATAVIAVAALVAGLVAATWQAYRARQAELVAEERAVEARDRAQREQVARQAEAAARARSETLNQFLLTLLRSPSPVRLGNQVTVAELLDQASRELTQQHELPATTQADFWLAIGQSYQGLGLYEQASAACEQCWKLRKTHLGLEHRDTLFALNELTLARIDRGELDAAAKLANEAYERGCESLGEQDEITLQAQSHIASILMQRGDFAEAAALRRKVLAGRRAIFPEDDLRVLSAAVSLATACRATNDLAEAKTLLEETCEKLASRERATHPLALASRAHLAGVYNQEGKHAQAQAMLEQVLADQEESLAPGHPDRWDTLSGLAQAVADQGRFREAIERQTQVVAGRRQSLGENHQDTLRALTALGRYQRQGNQLPQAALLLSDAVERLMKTLGERHPATWEAQHDLALVYSEQGLHEQAIPLAESVVRRSDERGGSDHRKSWRYRETLASCLTAAGRWDDALTLQDGVMRWREEQLGRDHDETLRALGNLAFLHWRRRQFSRSIPLYEEACKRSLTRHGAEHLETLQLVANLAVNYRDAGRATDAEKAWEQAVEMWGKQESERRLELAWIARDTAEAYGEARRFSDQQQVLESLLNTLTSELGERHPQAPELQARLGYCCLRQERYAAAEKALRPCLAERQRRDPEHWQVASTQSMLGEALSGLGEFREAETLLLAGITGLRARQAAIPPPVREKRIREAVERLVRHYQRADQPDALEMWRRELEMLDRPPSPPAS